MPAVAERILFAGDSHGDLGYLGWVLHQADQFEVDHIVQLGDFGYWEHREHGVEFLDRLNDGLEAGGYNFFWLDGNHENHTLLRSRYQPDGPTHIRSNIIYLPRGTRWEWDGVSFLAIGGAYSMDKDWRIEQYRKKARYSTSKLSAAKWEQWWPEETITDDEVELAIAGGAVDVVLAHDAPLTPDLALEFAKKGINFWKNDPNTTANRAQLQRVFDATNPSHWFHGHYHVDYVQKVDGCRFQGLNCNINQFRVSPWSWKQAITVVSTEELQHARTQ